MRWLALAALALTACAWTPGLPYATVNTAIVEVRLELPAGRLDGKAWKTSNGYALTLDGDALDVAIDQVALQAAATGGGVGGGTFDPAKPPAGYSLCHGGHCHRADGALKTYEEIAAELAGGGTTPAAATVLALSQEIPGAIRIPVGLVAGARLMKCQPDCNLERGQIASAKLSLDRLAAKGRVRALPGSVALGATDRSWTVSLPLRDLVFTGPVPKAIDRDQPDFLLLTGSLALPETLFDGIDWARLATQADPLVLDADPATRETLLANLAKSRWGPRLEHSPAI